MADNVETNPASGGAVFATDNIGGVNHPYAKMEFGADNTATPVSESDPLPVTDAGNGAKLDDILAALTGGSSTVEIGATSLAALELVGVKGADGATIASDANPLPVSVMGDLTVDLVGVKGSDGATIASDSNPLPVSVMGDLTVDLVGVKGVDGATIASGANPFPVDLGSTSLAALELIGIKGVDGSAIVANANPLPISDAGGSVTVDGTVELGATSLAALELIGIKGADGSGIAANANPLPISDAGGSLTVDGTVELGATSLAALESITIGTALPAGANTIGTVDLTAGSLAALELIGIKGTDGANIAADTNRLPVGLPDGAAVSGTVTSAAVLFTQDMLSYQSLTLQITSIGSGNTITFEASEDQTTWYAVICHQQGGVSGTGATSLGLRLYQRQARYFRARVSTYGSGTVTVQGTLSIVNMSPFSVPTSNGNGTLATGTGVVGNTVLRVTPVTDVNAPVNVAQINGVAPTMGKGASGTGVQRVTIANDSDGIISPVPMTSGGLSISRTLSANNTTGISAKGSAGQVYTIIAHNINAAARFLKLYNKATAPTVGTDTPVMTLPIPGNTAGAGFVIDTGGMGIAFATGIGYGITTGVADNDTGAPAANEVVVNVFYK